MAPTPFSLLQAVDPAAFPLIGGPAFDQPADGSLRGLLSGNQVVITKNLATTLGVRAGEQVSVSSDDGRALQVTIAGVIVDEGFYRRPQILMSLDGYRAV